jgi:diguanylate cyclase (GGDEF)-like protein
MSVRVGARMQLLLLLSLMWLAASASAADTQQPRRWSVQTEPVFQHLTPDHGLPDEIATDLAEDGRGFLWIGTYSGLTRWDGYRLRVYQADPRQPGALPDNMIQVLHGDAAGRLWIGTSAAGIVRHDPQTDRFVRYATGPRGLSHVSVRAIADDGAGGLWVGTDGGLDHLDPRNGSIATAQPEDTGLAAGGVTALLRDARGRLWVGSSAGLFMRDAGSRRFEPVSLSAAGPLPQALAEDSAGRIWVGTLQHGVFVLAGGALARPVRELTPPDGHDLLRNQAVGNLVEARPGEMWIGIVGQGIVAVALDEGESRRIRNVPTWPASLPDNATRQLYRDRAGLVWVATNRGVSRHDARQTAILTRFGSAASGDPAAPRAMVDVGWVQPMPDGRVWLGTHRIGIDILDQTGARVGMLRPDGRRPDTALPEGAVMGIAPASDGQVYIGTRRGLYRATADGRQVRRVALAGRKPTAPVWSVLAGPGVLWVGGETDGLWRLDLRTGEATAPLRESPERLTDERVVMLAHGPQGSLWVGTQNGLNRYDPASGAVSRHRPDGSANGLSAGFVSSLYADAQGRLWVGTYGGGIDVMTFGAGGAVTSVQRLDTTRGLPANSVNALLPDAQGRLWASTDDGLAVIDPATFAVRALRRADGVVFPTYWTGSAARMPDGELLFGGAGGLTIVRPERLGGWDYEPPVVVTDLQVGGRSVPAPVDAAAMHPLLVPADANSLAVEFAAIDFSAPGRNRYAYQLEGYDPGWIETDPSRRLAAYTNLPPGGYRLLLRGSNRDGAWSEKVLALPVRVQAAWHQTLWFRLAAALAALVLLVSVVQVRTRWLRARQAELERKVSERTAELEALHQALKEKSAVLERTSITDPLTGLHNRRFLTEHIDSQIAASLRRAQEARTTGAPVDTDSVFLLIDVDHFKRVNDLHGHAVGDAVLVQFAWRLRSQLRESDHLVRWGGEEFLAVARDTDRARAEELAERIRQAVAATPFDTPSGRLLPVTCSIGFACLPFVPWRPHALGWQDIVHLADEALLVAKRAGRDAWVGLHATEAAQPEGLLAEVHAGAQQALRQGQVRATSSRPQDAVLQALAPGGDANAPLPAQPAPAASPS